MQEVEKMRFDADQTARQPTGDLLKLTMLTRANRQVPAQMSAAVTCRVPQYQLADLTEFPQCQLALFQWRFDMPPLYPSIMLRISAQPTVVSFLAMALVNVDESSRR
jgi:hypothetical protein